VEEEEEEEEEDSPSRSMLLPPPSLASAVDLPPREVDFPHGCCGSERGRATGAPLRTSLVSISSSPPAVSWRRNLVADHWSLLCSRKTFIARSLQNPIGSVSIGLSNGFDGLVDILWGGDVRSQCLEQRHGRGERDREARWRRRRGGDGADTVDNKKSMRNNVRVWASKKRKWS
jgi:hypothetical protein